MQRTGDEDVRALRSALAGAVEAFARVRGRDAGDAGKPAVERAVDHREPLPAKRRTFSWSGPRREADDLLDARLVGARDRDRASHGEAERRT